MLGTYLLIAIFLIIHIQFQASSPRLHMIKCAPFLSCLTREQWVLNGITLGPASYIWPLINHFNPSCMLIIKLLLTLQWNRCNMYLDSCLNEESSGSYHSHLRTQCKHTFMVT